MNGPACETCNHGREVHEIDGKIGGCFRFGCPCSGYVRMVERIESRVMPHLTIQTVVYVKEHAHKGWQDEELEDEETNP